MNSAWKMISVLLAIVMAITMVFASITPLCAQPLEVWVDDDYCDGCPSDGHTWGYDAFAKIQDGIDAVASPGTVHVAEGTYYENIILKDGVQLLGAGADVTTIDGGSSGSAVTALDVGPDTVLDGFTITNGRADGGGGIYCYNSSPTIRNNKIINNYAVEPDPPDGAGGGIYCGNGSNAIILSNTIADNSANGNGGGIYFEFSSPTIDSNLIVGNIGALEGGGAQGGGIAGYGDSTAIISNNLIVDNSAVTVMPGVFEVGGGGISLDHFANAVIVNNTIDGNSTVYGYGGGIFCDYNASPIIENNIITNSPDGEGIWVSSVGAHPIIDYNNVWNNADGNYGGVAEPGENDISANPFFVDFQNGDYHLQAASPCIDAGDNSAPDLPTTDFEGDDRVIDGDKDGIATVDIGADEYAPHIDKLKPRKCEPGEKIRIIGYGFGDTQGDSVVHISKRTFDSSSPRIKFWSDTKIRIRVPNYKCEWFHGEDSRRRKVWVTVDGVDSNKKRLKVTKPAVCP